MRVPWNRAGARPKRHLIILMQTLIPQPSAVGATSSTGVPHLTGHVTGQMAGQRAVTGYVRRDRFHALTPTRNKPSFTPRRSGGRGEGAPHMTTERCACARARGPRR
jgi:hypothetical protein